MNGKAKLSNNLKLSETHSDMTHQILNGTRLSNNRRVDHDYDVYTPGRIAAETLNSCAVRTCNWPNGPSHPTNRDDQPSEHTQMLLTHVCKLVAD